MPDPNEIDLAVLFADDTPPAHDAAFVSTVAARVARRRLAGELTWGALVAAVAALILWAVGPVFGPALRPISSTLLAFMPIIATVAGVWVVAHPRPVR